MINVKEILNGWKNYIVTDVVIEEIAKKRAEICASCPMAKKGLHTALLKDYKLKEIQGFYCSDCGCPLSAKVRSKDNQCPKKRWIDITT